MAYKKYTLQDCPMPPLGIALKAYFTTHRTRKATLSKIMGKSPNSIMRYQKQDNFLCKTLWHLSLGLNHNFFMDLAAQLPAHFTTNAPDPALPLQQRIAALEEENKLLKTKVETLMQVIGK